ncbi:MAG: hypothetical protein ABFD79_02900 [Phycisphaerales bacterium]
MKIKTPVLMLSILFVICSFNQLFAQDYIAIDLTVPGFSNLASRCVNGDCQVGYADSDYRINHAIMWNSGTQSYIDLNPSGYTCTEAYGVSGNQQV